MMIATILDGVESLETRLAALERVIAHQLAATVAPTALWRTAPAVGPHTAAVIVAEGGATVDAFPSAAPLSAWAGLSPGQHECGGRIRLPQWGRRHYPQKGRCDFTTRPP